MQRGPTWLRRAVGGAIAGVTAFGTLSGLAVPQASAAVTTNNVYGANRYQTATNMNAAKFGAAGAGAVVLADGLPAHQVDALAASGYAGANKNGVMLTDNTASVPSDTTTGLGKVDTGKKITIVGGTDSVSAAQQTQLTGLGYTVTRISGSDRYATMQAIDGAIPAASVGTSTCAGKSTTAVATAILASGDNAHMVDALSAGGLAFKKVFPVILTPSSSSTLGTQAAAVISSLGIKCLIVAGGPAAVPTSQYSPAPSGITAVDSSATTGANRSATSELLEKDAVANYGFSNTALSIAAGSTYVGSTTTVQNDGADALSGAPFNGDPTPLCITNGPTDAGSAPQCVSDLGSTLTTVNVETGPQNMPASQVTQIEAGSGNQPPSAVTALPQLVGAKVLGTVAPNQVSPTTPAGTTVQYQFSSKVTSITAGNFLIYPFNWDSTGATSSCSGSQPPAAIAGSPKLSGCAGSIESNGTNVDILFPYVSNNPSAPANQVPSNYTLATVMKNAVTTTAGTTNPEGSAAIGSSSNNTTTATANTTAAPDLTGVTFGTTSSNSTQTPTNFTFDKAAFLTTGGAAGPLGGSGVNQTASGAPVQPTGQTPGFFLVFPNNIAVQCDTQNATSTTAGSGTIPGGNGTTTITVMCANNASGAAGGVALTNGSLDTTSNVARAFVGTDTVTGATATAVGSCPATGGAVSTTVFCNPLQAFHFGGATTAPDLVSVTGEPAGTNGNADTTRDAVLFTFDQNANTAAATNTGFNVFQSGANEIPSTAAVSGATVGGNVNQVLAYFPKGTLNGTAAGSTGPAVGASANASATNPAVAYSGVGGLAPSGGTTGNQPDELGLTPSTTSTTVTPGTVDGPQLASVALSQTTTPAQTQSFVATFTFTQPVNGLPASIINGDFKLYLKDGTELDATTCGASSAAATNASVTCSAFTIVSSPSGLTPGPATSAQIGSALLGTVTQDAVTGTATGFTAKNPEGGQNTTGHT